MTATQQVARADAYLTRATEVVLQRVREERVRQEKKYGHVNPQLVSGTGPDIQWLLPLCADSASVIQEELRRDYEAFENETGLPTWVHLVREEIAEAFQETDETLLAEELVQVAALCVSWVERLLPALRCDRCGEAAPYRSSSSCIDCLEAAL